MKQHSLRLPDELMEAIDSKRGRIPRNPWLIEAIRVGMDSCANSKPEHQIIPEAYVEPLKKANAERNARGKPRIAQSKEPKEIPLPKYAKRHWA